MDVKLMQVPALNNRRMMTILLRCALVFGLATTLLVTMPLILPTGHLVWAQSTEKNSVKSIFNRLKKGMKSIKQRTTAQPSTKSVVVTPRKTAPARITRALRKAPLPRARPWLANDAGTTQRPNLINSFKKFRTAKATKKTAIKLAEEAPTKTTEATIGGVLSRARQKPRGGPLVLVKLSKSAMRSSCPKRSLVGIQAVNAPTRVRLSPQANVQRQLGFALANWVRDVVQTEASRHLGSPVVKLRVAASFSCRTRNGVKGAKLSEHGLGNAIDISEFTLADGRKINVAKGWKGRRPERKFLRAVNEGACKHFTTVLGPNADRFHRDHFHLDLARHGQAGAYRVCK